ncbi:MAG: polysaccharide deacetylase family protein [Proteobacteria bacterium]|nr:polysaccharide deacetylase family protein [Pseudomonadota bacterium]
MDFWGELETELGCWSEAAPVSLWWRDDDTALPTASLARLARLSREAGAPLALAVVPKLMAPELTAALSSHDTVQVIQHGFAHVNHAPAAPGGGAWELGRHRPAAIVRAELREGRDRLEAAFGSRFIPALVPPWNRIDSELLPSLPALGFTGLSRFGARAMPEAAPGLPQVNTHYDPVAWRRERRFSGRADAAVDLIGHWRRRRTGEADAAEPTGILTHHWALDEEAWAFLEALIPFLARNSHVRILSAAELFC